MVSKMDRNKYVHVHKYVHTCAQLHTHTDTDAQKHTHTQRHRYVTGYWKTDHVRIFGQLLFIGPANSHTHTLPVHCCINGLS